MEILKRRQEDLAKLVEARDAAIDEYDRLAIADDATEEQREAALSAAEEARKAVDDAMPEVTRLQGIAEARKNAPTIVAVDDKPETRTDVKVGKEEATYRPTGGVSFFADIARSMKGNAAALERLSRHEQETRDLSTTATAGGGFVPPVYLGELFADIPRPGRDFANALPSRPLPAAGMNITIPRITTGPAVAVTTAENAAVNEVDLVEATITVPVRTVAGQQDVSQQLLDRSDPSIDSIIFGDLRSSYDQQLDTQLLAGTGASGQVLGIRAVSGVNTVAYTDGTPTAAELLPKLYDAIQKIATTRYAPADTIVMHPRRAAWLASQLSSTFPLFQQGNLMQAAGTQDNGMLNTFAGLNVVLDASIATNYGAGTNEDEIYILRAADVIFMESPLQSRVLPEVLSGTLTVRLQLFGYAAFASARYPTAIAIVSGTGLVTPVF